MLSKPQAKDMDVVAKQKGQDQVAMPLFPVTLPRCFSSFQAQVFIVSCHMAS